MKAPMIGAALAALILSCQNPGLPVEPASPGGPLWTSELWDPLDAFDPGRWERAEWTNGGMFYCGFRADHALVADGALTLRLDNVPSSGKPYSSGEVRSRATFGYGTFETSMRAASGSGIVSSFFLYTPNPWDEIDIEVLGKNPRQVQFNYFVDGVGGHEKVVDLGFDASAGTHRYAIEWGPGFIRWFVDGQRLWEVSGPNLPRHPMQLMVNLWPGTGVDSWLGPFRYTQPRSATYEDFRYTPQGRDQVTSMVRVPPAVSRGIDSPP